MLLINLNVNKIMNKNLPQMSFTCKKTFEYLLQDR